MESTPIIMRGISRWRYGAGGITSDILLPALFLLSAGRKRQSQKSDRGLQELVYTLRSHLYISVSYRIYLLERIF